MDKLTMSVTEAFKYLWYQTTKRGVPGGWGLVRLKFTRGTPPRHALRSAKPIQMCRLGDCSTLDTLPGVFKLLVQNSDDVRLGLKRLKGGVGVRWGPTDCVWKRVKTLLSTFVLGEMRLCPAKLLASTMGPA